MTIALNMIVKDEAHIVARALRSVRPHIDYWVVLDTGSSDATKQVVLDTMQGIPGELHDHPWQGFGEARTKALAMTAGKADYALVVDADEIVSGVKPSGLTEDAYALWMTFPNGTRGRTHRLLSMRRAWHYVGVIHEYPDCDASYDPNHMCTSLLLTTPQDGARSRDPHKHRKVAATLEEALAADPGNERYVFHLALAYRDAGDDENALRHFLRRTTMGHGLNGEEIYVSWLEAGRALERLRRDGEAISMWLRAHACWPERCEAPRELYRTFAWRSAIAQDVGTLYNEFHCSMEMTT